MMNLVFLKILFILSMVTCTASCKQRVTQGSKEKHVFGETSRDGKNVEICPWQEDKSINIYADRYLAKIAEYIAMRNKDTFQGYFSIANICIYLQKADSINAIAMPNRNEIRFNSQTLLAASSDADVASIIGHELAHLTMQSTHVEEIPPNVVRHPDWPKIREKFEVERRKVEKLRAPFAKKAMTAEREQRKIHTQWAQTLSKQLRDEILLVRNQITDIFSDENVNFSPEDLEALKALELPRLPRPEPTYDPNSPAAANGIAKSKQDNRQHPPISELKDHQNLIYAKLRQESPDLMKTWENNLTVIAENSAEVDKIDNMLTPFQKEFDLFIRTVAGEDATFNWREQEADEVGYEFYLRAGLDPKHMIWLSKTVMGEKAFNECMANYVEKKIAPTRGSGSHPSDCWRIYDYLVLEPEYHQKEYAPLIQAARTIDILPGELAELKKSL